MTTTFYKYDVALSFAEEDREFVDCVARQLTDKRLKIFYDEYERVDMWGKNLRDRLDDIYRRRARFCVMFISVHYAAKYWAQYEQESALIRALKSKREYILPFMIDETRIEEIPKSISHFTRDRYDCVGLATVIASKIELNARKRLPGKFRSFFSNKYRSVATALTASGLFAGVFSENLTSVESLTRKLHEESKHIIHGSICRDGMFRSKRGSGTCSHHGGVERIYDSVEYRKTWAECRKEAEEISWLDP